MKHRHLLSLGFVLLLYPLRFIGQDQPDITGLWKGELYVDSTKKTLPYEVAISEYKGKLVGFSWILFTDSGRDETGTREISVRRKGDEIILEDDAFINNTYIKEPPKHIRKLMVVKLTVGDTMMVLEGGWSTNRTRRFLSATGTVKMYRKKDFKNSELYKKLDTLKRTPELVFHEPVFKPKAEVAAVSKSAAAILDPDKPVPSAPKPEPVPEPVVVKEDPPAPKPAPVPEPIVVKADPPAPRPEPVVVKTAPPPPKPAPVVVKADPPKPTPPVVKPAPPKPAPVVVKADPPAPRPVPPKPAPVVAKPAPPKPAPVVVKADPPAPKPVVAAPPKPLPVEVDPNAAKEVNKRTIASSQGIFFESDSLVLTLYDNGSVDGDTVSVLMNGGLIFAKQGLTTNANSKTIYITPDMGDSIKLVMYAENLGSIPPNTGLLLVKDGEKSYYVRFSADLTSNAQIILQRKRKEE